MTGSADRPEPALVPLRPPDEVMRLARLGAFHQTRLSFLRVLLRRIAREGWGFERTAFEIDRRGVGHAVYVVRRGARAYALVAFAHDLAPEKRTDRVIAEEWDATFALYDGHPGPEAIARLAGSVPRQEAGRYRQSELVLARANRSVRLFDAAVAALAEGRQPEAAAIEATGYLMRTTAVYGNGKFGIADRDLYADREELAGPFQAEMLTVWLIRAFTVDLVEHLARWRNPAGAVRLEPALRRRLGIGNATGLGMAPFLVRHQVLIDRWIAAREMALARVRALAGATDAEIEKLISLIGKARVQIAQWQTEDAVQAPRIAALSADLEGLEVTVRRRLAEGRTARLWDELHLWAGSHLSREGQELLVSLLIEPHGTLVDDLAGAMSADEAADFVIDGRMGREVLLAAIDGGYGWARAIDFSQPQASARFWYVSEEKLEPRLGERASEPGAGLEQPLAVARDVMALREALLDCRETTIGALLRRSPEHRHAVRRVQIAMRHPYAEIRDNLIGAELRAVDILRCKLSFFGCTRFDPRSDKWLRITLFQGAPFPDEIGQGDWDGWIWEASGRAP